MNKRLRVVITGTHTGMGRELAWKFLSEGHLVFGLDIKESTIKDDNYQHVICDVSDRSTLPVIDNVDVLINNAGVQNTEKDIETNLLGVINCTEEYGLHENIKSILNQASVSAHNGAEFPYYVASKGGVLSYTKWVAKEVAKYGATCNSISFGGVLTGLNMSVLKDKESWDDIMSMTPLKKWVTEEEAAEWMYFLTVINKSMTAQDVLIDNGEMHNHKFVWK